MKDKFYDITNDRVVEIEINPKENQKFKKFKMEKEK